MLFLTVIISSTEATQRYCFSCVGGGGINFASSDLVKLYFVTWADRQDTELHRILVYCTARQCSPLRRKFMECSINSPALSLLMKHLVIGECLKTPNFLAFHWSPCGSLVSIGQHFVATRVVHLPKSTETSLITESNQSGLNHRPLQLCTAPHTWF